MDLLRPVHQHVLPALQPHGFWPEYAISGESRAVLISRIAPRTCAYVILRERSRTVYADFRVAPPQIPDDRLQNLPGRLFEIGQSNNFPAHQEPFLQRVAQNAVSLLPQLPSVAAAIEDELRESSQPWVPYARAMIAWEALCNDAEARESAAMAYVRQVAAAVAAGELTDDHIAAACNPLVKEFREKVAECRDSVFDGKIRVLTMLMRPHPYLDAVVRAVPVSRSANAL
jgi:hypothetical protein